VRCHLAAAGHPIAGDEVYGPGRPRPPGLARQFLHACAVELPHPITGRMLRIEAPLPHDLTDALESCRPKPV
jgi:23S rRNA-/tRNA-specific pseudouridylate synthase